MSTIPWKRVRRGLAQYARQHGLPLQRVEAALTWLRQLGRMCGEATQSRQALYRLGFALLPAKPTQLFVPICPAYSHNGEQHTYTHVTGDVPLLVSRHAPFVRGVQGIVGAVRVTFLLADYAAHDSHCASAMGITTRQFQDLVQSSLRATRREIVGTGWHVELMSSVVPDFFSAMAAEEQRIEGDRSLDTFLDDITRSYGMVYRMIGFPQSVWRAQTVRNSAAYRVFARFVRARGAVAVNHSNALLTWYRREDAALLHNACRIFP